MHPIFFIAFFVLQSTAQESTTELTTTTAAPLICNPESFKLIMDDAFHYDKPRTISVKNNKKEECSRNPSYIWSVYQLNTDANPGQITNVKIENVLEFEGPSENPENNLLLYQAEESVELYVYRLQMSVQLIPAEGWNPWFQNKTFLVKPYDMTILLKGSYNRVHLYKSEDLILDASMSIDKSYRDDGVKAMNANVIEWQCQPPSVKAPEPQPLTWTIPDEVLYEMLAEDVPVITCVLSITRKGTPFYPQTRSNRQYITLLKPPSPKIQLTCTSNCDPSDAYTDTTFFYQCLSECLRNDPEWTFRPYNETIAKNYITDSKNGYFTFRAGAFKPGDKLEVETTLADTTASLSLTFRIPQPVLSLKCIANCQYEPRGETIVQLNCESDCDHLKLTWEISRADFNPHDWLTDEMLTIGPDVFKDGDNLIITVTSYDSIATLDMTFHEEVPALVLSCQLSDTTDCKDSEPDPRENIHLTVKCEEHCDYLKYSWVIDPEPSGYDIENNLNPPDRNILTINGNTYVDKQHIKVTVSSGRTSVVLETTYVVKVPELDIECLSNCNKEVGNTMEETKLKPVCIARCGYLDYSWSVNNHPSGRVKTWVGDKKVLIIPAGTLNDGDNTFTLTSGEGVKTVIKPYVKPVPQLTITCEANCENPNPAKETVLKVHCQPPPSLCNFEYQWSITPLPPEFSWTERATFSGQRTVLTIKPHTFKDQDNIEFKVTDGEKAELVFPLRYTEPVPDISIVCDKNCDPSHPMDSTELRVICNSNCEADYEWEFEPKSAHPIKDIHATGLVVTIAGEAYSDGSSVTATVKSGAATKTFTISYKTQPPVLLLACRPPCEDPHDPKELVVVNVTCTSYCPKVLDYTWLVTPDHDEKNVVYQKNKDSLILLPDAFSDGKIAKIEVSTDSTNKVEKKLVFSEVPPDITIQCVSNCWEGSPLKDTVLAATCKEFCKNIDSYVWTFEPSAGAGLIYAPKNVKITIKPETYKDLDIVDVMLVARNANRTKKLTFIELPPVLTVTCLTNCNPSNPFEDVALEANCTKYCYRLQYEWDKVEPQASGWDVAQAHLSKQNAVMMISKESFKDGDAHRFFVKSRKGSAFCDVRFAVPPAELKLVCVSNCQPSANPLMEITIQAMCLRFCYDNYKWSLSPLGSNVDLSEPEGPNNTLIIPSEAYPDQGSVRVKIFTSQSETFMDIYFMEPTPVLNVTCVSCEIGIQNPFSETTLTVACSENCDHVKYTWEFSPTTDAVSYDPDNMIATIPPETFEDKQQLLVIVRSGKAKTEVTVLYRTPPAYIVIACVNENCPYANPLKPVVFSLTCFYDCEDQEWIWEIEPHDPNFNWEKNIQTENNKMTLTILPEAFADGQVIQLSVWSGKSEALRNKFVVKFEEPIPSVTITCVKNCNPYSSVRDVEVKATCSSNCESPVYEWTLEPKSHHVILADNKLEKLIIKAGSYYFNETVTILLKFRKAHVNMTITFAPAGWDGQCFYEPEGGISGVTLFAIGCDYFQDGATYRAYQDYSGNALGVLLTYGQSKFLDFVYLSAGKSTLTVVVGNGFETKKKIRLKVGKVEPFPATAVKQAGSQGLFKKIVGEDSEDFGGMVKRRTNVQKTVQFASLLWTALEGVPVVDFTHFTKHIIAGINTLSDKIEPTQQLSLYSKFVSKPPTDMFTIRLLTEGIEKTVNHLISIKTSSLYQNDEALPNFCTETLSLLSTLITEALSQSEKQPKPLPSFDYPSRANFEPARADFRRNLRKFTHDLLATTQVLPTLCKEPETSSKVITIKIGKLTASDAKNRVSVTVTGSESYIETSPKFGHTLQATGLEFSYVFGFFAQDPFWWQDLGINTDVVQFSADDLPEEIFVHLRVKQDKDPGGFSGKVVDRIVYEFSVQRKAVFSVSFSFKNFEYRVQMYPRILETIIKGPETLDYLVEEEKFMYVVITSIVGKETEYAATYQMLECFSWSTGNLAPTKDGCKVFKKSPQFVSCECSHLSHFAGKLSIPQITTQTTKTLQSAPKAPNFFIPITLAVSILLFLLLLAYAFFKDTQEKKSQLMFLPDNQPGDSELYIINIATGITTATTSDVAIELTGTEAKTRIHLIQSETHQPLTKRNEEHFFAMYTEKYLGDLVSIRMWTNYKGSTPNFYCERVMIEHLPSRTKYQFLIEKSFSVLDGDCSGTFYITSTKLKFWQRFREAVRVNHHVLTLFTQRPRGVNIETVVIGYASCTFAMFVALILTIYAPQIDLLPTAAISAAVTLPVTFLLNNLFRNSP